MFCTHRTLRRFQITVGLPFSDKELTYAVAETFSSDEQCLADLATSSPLDARRRTVCGVWLARPRSLPLRENRFRLNPRNGALACRLGQRA
jgi:hypothetical protein